MKDNCIICGKEIDLEEVEHVTGVSIGEYWCKPCAQEVE